MKQKKKNETQKSQKLGPARKILCTRLNVRSKFLTDGFTSTVKEFKNGRFGVNACEKVDDRLGLYFPR